jgi:hypothetical protein
MCCVTFALADASTIIGWCSKNHTGVHCWKREKNFCVKPGGIYTNRLGFKAVEMLRVEY